MNKELAEQLTKLCRVHHDPQYPYFDLDTEIANFLDKCGKSVKVTLEVVPDLEPLKTKESFGLFLADEKAKSARQDPVIERGRTI